MMYAWTDPVRSRLGEGKRESIRARTQSGCYRSCKAIHPSRCTEGRSILVASGRTAPGPGSSRPVTLRAWRFESRSNRAIRFGSLSFTQTRERSTSSCWVPTDDEVGAGSGRGQSPKSVLRRAAWPVLIVPWDAGTGVLGKKQTRTSSKG